MCFTFFRLMVTHRPIPVDVSGLCVSPKQTDVIGAKLYPMFRTENPSQPGLWKGVNALSLPPPIAYPPGSWSKTDKSVLTWLDAHGDPEPTGWAYSRSTE